MSLHMVRQRIRISTEKKTSFSAHCVLRDHQETFLLNLPFRRCFFYYFLQKRILNRLTRQNRIFS